MNHLPISSFCLVPRLTFICQVKELAPSYVGVLVLDQLLDADILGRIYLDVLLARDHVADLYR